MKRLGMFFVFSVAFLVTFVLGQNQSKGDEFSVTSIKDLLKTNIVESYRVDKKIADFPEKFDLSTPENAYSTQKHLIVSNQKDKIEQLGKLQFYFSGKFSEREQRQLKKETDSDWQKTYKEKFVVYEVIKFRDDLAFVFALRQFDNLYDGNLFQKKTDDGLWYNHGNFQRFKAEEIADDIVKSVNRLPKGDEPSVTSIKDLLKTKIVESYRVDKKIADFPEKFDLSTPENAYSTQKHLIISNQKDKIEQMGKMQFYSSGKFSEREQRQLEEEIDSDWQKTYKEKFVVYEVIKFRDDLAFVFALRQFDNLYDGNLFQKKTDDGLWYNLGNFQRFKAEEIANDVVKSVNRSSNNFVQKQPSQEELKRLAEIEKTDWFQLLNDKQKNYVRWDERQFAYVYDPKNYEVRDDDRAAIERHWIKRLEGAETGYPGHVLSVYDEAIIGLATIKSHRVAELLLKIAAEKVVKDNAHRHFATKALGMLGDVSVIPELIPLVYHFNYNTRWDAQVALVRLTGQNFGTDTEAWGKWYNENREKLAQSAQKELPVFDPKPIDWIFGSDDPELKKWSDPKVQEQSDNQQLGGKQ